MGALETRLEQALGDRYRLEREIGRGGMAVVYLAEDLRHHRRVAVKVLEPELARALGAERFLREIEIAARLTHPNILALHDSGDAGDSLLYYVMPFVEGESLRTRLDRERQLPLEDAVRIAREVAGALAYAHARRIIHRDIKPENILLSAGSSAEDRDAHALVSDFGIAHAVGESAGDRLTQTGLSLGTPTYMSPEQAAGEREVDARSDIYSLGCVVYEMLAGEPPYTGPTAQAILARKAVEPVPRLRVVRDTVPAAVEAVITRALARTPADRFATAAQFGEALQRALTAPSAGLDDQTDGLGSVAGARSRSRTRRSWIVAAVVGTAALIGAAVLFRSRTPNAPPLEYTPLTSFAESATSPAISPDGKYLAFILGESTFFGPGQIYVKQLPNGEPVQLTNDDLFKMAPKFSADGSRITYTTLSGPTWNTLSVPVLGKQAPRVVLENAEGLTWIAAGAGRPGVLFSAMTGSDVQMGIVTATESRAEQRTVYMPPKTGMAHRSYLSPDGKQVLLIEMDYYSWLPCRLVPFDGSGPGKSIGPVPSQCTDAAWSPDGKWMYFSANAGGGFHIWRQRFPDGKPEQLTFGVTEEEGIAIDPGGRSFVTSIGTRQSTIWVHDARGDRQITSEGYGMLPSFSSDGKTLYYLLRAGGSGSYVSGELWAVDLESNERRRLLPDFRMQAYDISADGTRVVFVAADDSTRSPLWVARLDGRTAPRRLVANDVLTAFFGAAGDVVFGARENDRNFIYRMTADEKEPRKITQASVLAGVSPDGQWMAVWGLAAGGDRLDALHVQPIGDGAARFVCRQCGAILSFERGPWPPNVGWSPDGRFLYLDLYTSPYAIPLRPGEPLPPIPAAGLRTEEDVAALPGARRISQPHLFTGPNPSVYAFTKVAIQRNVYRVPVR